MLWNIYDKSFWLWNFINHECLRYGCIIIEENYIYIICEWNSWSEKNPPPKKKQQKYTTYMHYNHSYQVKTIWYRKVYGISSRPMLKQNIYPNAVVF